MPPIRLGAEDRAILELESPTVAGHTCKILRLGPQAPGVAELRGRIAERIHLAPALTRRLGTDASGAPAWVPDPDFTIADHVVEHRHDGPVDPDGLRTCVARLFENRLDRARPLWRMDVVELADGERALVWRLHHALADGTASIRYARALLWDEAPEERMTARQAAARHAVDEARRRGHLAGYLRREFKRSRARSPFDGQICAQRSVGFAAAPLGALRQAAKVIDGATLNDAVLSIVTGALGHWVRVHHGDLGTIRVKVPVSLHREEDAAANRDSMFSLGLPLGEPDPVARLRIVHARTRARKEARDAERREVLLHRASEVSPRLQRFATQLERSPRRFALNVSNVPGPPRPVKILASPVRRLHSLAEISEHHALRVSVISLADLLCFGFCADADLVPDVQSMAARVEPEARALLGALTQV
ncbi:MAG: wax ester/triacylglycerol synthase domain-containing protein [Solirubrobacteraceae bacterium]